MASFVNRCGRWVSAKLPFHSLIWVSERCHSPHTPPDGFLNNAVGENKTAATKLLAYGLLANSCGWG